MIKSKKRLTLAFTDKLEQWCPDAALCSHGRALPFPLRQYNIMKNMQVLISWELWGSFELIRTTEENNLYLPPPHSNQFKPTLLALYYSEINIMVLYHRPLTLELASKIHMVWSQRPGSGLGNCLSLYLIDYLWPEINLAAYWNLAPWCVSVSV